MGIKHIPDSYQEFHRFKMDYEREKFVYSDDNHRIGTYTLELFQSWYPGFLARPVATAVYALIDERMSLAFGFPKGRPGCERWPRRACVRGPRWCACYPNVGLRRRQPTRTIARIPVIRGLLPPRPGFEHDHPQRAN